MIINQRFVDWVNSHDAFMGVVIPYDKKYIDYVLETDDDIGVLLPGGEDLGMFPERDEFELSLVEACEKAGVPLFGICKGMQIINKYHGGTLRRCDGHWQEHVEHASTHNVLLERGNIFSDALVSYNVPVNSFHRWCVDKVGDGIEVCGYSEGHDDPAPECLCVKDKPVAAVQWHPSYAIPYWVSKSLLDLFCKLGKGDGQ